MLLLAAVAFRPDSAALLDPFVGEVGSILNSPKDTLRQAALTMLGLMNPNPSPKAIGLLTSHLDDPSNSLDISLTICASLLQMYNDELIKTVLTFAQKRGDPDITAGVVRGLGLNRSHNEEGLALIGKSLDSPNQSVKLAAVDAASRADGATRARFLAQLHGIASDGRESAEVRSAAQAAIESPAR